MDAIGLFIAIWDDLLLPIEGKAGARFYSIHGYY